MWVITLLVSFLFLFTAVDVKLILALSLTRSLLLCWAENHLENITLIDGQLKRNNQIDGESQLYSVEGNS